MKGPIGKKQKYPGGKALRRIRYFETQRGLFQSSAEEDTGLPALARHPLPIAYYAKAHKAKQRLISQASGRAQLPLWLSLGPSSIPHSQTYGIGGNNAPPVSGRCVGIMISPADPAHLVLCSAGGGLWGTSDQGKTWQPLTDEQPTLSMGAIAYAPGSPDIVYAGTGEGDTYSPFGVGLLRSGDGGKMWKPAPSDDPFQPAIFDIAVDPKNAEHLWVGTTEGLFESADGGITWRQIKLETPTQIWDPIPAWDISINPCNAEEILAATAAGLIHSADGGANWAVISDLPSESRFTRMEVCHAPSDPCIVYVVAVADSQASLWRRASASGPFLAETPAPLQAGSDIGQADYNFCLAVSPLNPNLVYWGASHLYKGTREIEGWRWQNISSRPFGGDSIHPDQHHIAFDPSDANVIYACNDGGVFRSPDGGASWVALNAGLIITEFEFIIQLESQDDWVIGGTQDNGTLGKATNGTWNEIATGDGGDCGVDDAKNLCYHSYYGMPIERAPVSGARAFSWDDVSPPVPDGYKARFYPPMDVSREIVAKAGVTLFVSEDNGEHWEEVKFGGGRNASAVMIFNTNTIFVGTERGRLMRIDRASAGWSDATITPLKSPRSGFISDIVIPGTPDKVIWLSYSTLEGGHVFRSLNGGRTWSDRSGNMPVIPVNAIVVDPKDQQRVFAATDHGVYQTKDAGGKWSDFGNGLPNAVIGDMILHERRRLLRVGTRSRGVWEVNI